MQTARGKAEVLGRKAKVQQIPCASTNANTSSRGLTRFLAAACQFVSRAAGVCYQLSHLLMNLHLTQHDSEFSSKDLKSVGNYTLGRLIGKGSFGKVYLATHKLTNGSKVRNL